MIQCFRILRTRSPHGLEFPLHTRRTVDGQTVEVLGLVKKQVKTRCVVQWWIVSLETPNKKPPRRR